jgi:hypothetical protein
MTCNARSSLFQHIAAREPDCCCCASSQELEAFWRSVQRLLESGVLTHDQLFRKAGPGNRAVDWLKEAAKYRALGEQLDIVNWYYKNKHRKYDKHYIDGLEDPDEYEIVAGVKAVKDNMTRPGRYRMIQAEELRRPPHLVPDSLKLAKLLKELGTGRNGVKFEAVTDWQAALVQLRKRRALRLQYAANGKVRAAATLPCHVAARWHRMDWM